MFRRWPFFQRLLSWTKPYALSEPGSPLYERSDWNSLLTDDPAATSLQRGLMDGSSSFPTRAEMEANLVAFTERSRAGRPIRLHAGAPHGWWTRPTAADSWSRRPMASTAARCWWWRSVSRSPGCPRCRAWSSSTTTARSSPPSRTPASGCSSSASRTPGSSLPPACCRGRASWCSRRPSPTSLSVSTRTLVGVRARYLQPYEDAVLGGGVTILDAAIDRVEPSGGRGPDGACATHRPGCLAGLHGRRGHRRDRVHDAAPGPAGARLRGRGPEPAAGPDALVGERHAARPVLRGHHHPGCPRPAPARRALQLGRGPWRALQRPGAGGPHRRDTLRRRRRSVRSFRRHAAIDQIARELTESPALFHQRGYLARRADRRWIGWPARRRHQPLAHALDSGGPARSR